MQLILLMMSTGLLETCRELKQIHRNQLCIKLVIYQDPFVVVRRVLIERNTKPESLLFSANSDYGF